MHCQICPPDLWPGTHGTAGTRGGRIDAPESPVQIRAPRFGSFLDASGFRLGGGRGASAAHLVDQGEQGAPLRLTLLAQVADLLPHALVLLEGAVEVRSPLRQLLGPLVRLCPQRALHTERDLADELP